MAKNEFKSAGVNAKAVVKVTVSYKDSEGKRVAVAKVRTAESLGYDVSRFPKEETYDIVISSDSSSSGEKLNKKEVESLIEVFGLIEKNLDIPDNLVKILNKVDGIRFSERTDYLPGICLTFPDGKSIPIPVDDYRKFNELIPIEYKVKALTLTNFMGYSVVFNRLKTEVVVRVGCSQIGTITDIIKFLEGVLIYSNQYYK